MSKVKIACVQMLCSADRMENIAKAEKSVCAAAQNGANIILLPELFERRYFCQERRYDYYEYAESVEDNLAVQRLQKLSAELNVVLPVSFYEKDGNVFYNSAAMLDGGKLLGVYRKTHIPDDHYYQEKFYFTPGNTGFKVFATQFGNVGVGICWDQWFPETARCLALNGADVILYPTAIGEEPILSVDSAEHWQRVMQGHAAANVLPVAAANRIGTETVSPCAENGGQSSSLVFYGSSFLTDATGKIIARAAREKEQILYAEYDFDEIKRLRREWGLFRDRRPETYMAIVK
ncbi:MAG TPA: N-carbamoylputrescine amidase [Candidatus Borkfalkia excrementigallinarum]|uniref:N-carbamoylputrescine amidase n=1 Tax=Candidatus Borkfalkia excrementigallinarum TaxID=2838506 RepID=A0A9D2CTE3_9FIRM|nr:N-carbamoylputrescine amidase [Candidatus Borkfalkia excrementigallinarum]